MDCNSRTALVAWFSTGGAEKYVVTAISASGHNDTCETVHTNCELHGVLCGQSYSISVEALGGTCSSIGHMQGVLVTGEQQCAGLTNCMHVYHLSKLSIVCLLSPHSTERFVQFVIKQLLSHASSSEEVFLFAHHKSVFNV